jgi:hypothetical protein
MAEEPAQPSEVFLLASSLQLLFLTALQPRPLLRYRPPPSFFPALFTFLSFLLPTPSARQPLALLLYAYAFQAFVLARQAFSLFALIEHFTRVVTTCHVAILASERSRRHATPRVSFPRVFVSIASSARLFFA